MTNNFNTSHVDNAAIRLRALLADDSIGVEDFLRGLKSMPHGHVFRLLVYLAQNAGQNARAGSRGSVAAIM